MKTLAFLLLLAGTAFSQTMLPCFTRHEVSLQSTGSSTNPYAQITATAEIRHPRSSAPWRIPLFWDGANTWKLRFAPDCPGNWQWRVDSSDPGLDEKFGVLKVIPGTNSGSIRPMASHPRHFERQDGTPFWFLGDTAWALVTDSKSEKHDRAAAARYLQKRAGQGVNVVHTMLLSEAGWSNQGGPPFLDLASESINPDYWREVDHRIALANRAGIVCGLAIAWGDKQGKETYPWRRFPSIEARLRYARYIAARYSAFDVYFLVAGEWHAEIRTRNSTEKAIREEFFRIGEALDVADPHNRMIGIHPMTSHGSVREFITARWMTFGDYQQNYNDLHERVLLSIKNNKPVVNSEYGYFLRDQSGDGVPDKDNSTSLESMRHATWDIVMAGAYPITGFGTTYFGGNRDPGPFDLDAPKNQPWEEQYSLIRKFFTQVEWWKLEPHDEILQCTTPRSKDRPELKQLAPPATTYWCLAEPARQYVIYMRGLEEPLQ